VDQSHSRGWSGGTEARLPLGSLPAVASAPRVNAKVCHGQVQEETICKFHLSGNASFTQSVRKYVQHSNRIRFIKKLAIKFLGIHHLNFESCNILLVCNNTVSHIYIIILYITKIAVSYY